MDRNEFVGTLKKEGFPEPVMVTREAGVMDIHTHEFEAMALIVQGELAITRDGAERIYRAGDVFHLLADVPHSERYGPEGVQYLVGRKQASN
jgi:quercetin dioxygenase-like cupin family protein